MPALDGSPARDFNTFLHDLRSRGIARMPGGASTFVSAGCSGRWYFDWISEFYPTPIKRHIGVEAFSPPPPDLPAGVEWLPQTLSAMPGLLSGEADLVFAGQVIEHLWPADLVGFLAETHRILRPGGWFVLDSPNRRLTETLGWTQPEHTFEFTVEEICELLDATGFDPVVCRGLWLCYDRELHRVLPLDPEEPIQDWAVDRRITEGEKRPEDSFVWWIEASRKEEITDRKRASAVADAAFIRANAVRFTRFAHAIGRSRVEGRQAVIASAVGESGFLLYGPYVPVAAGQYVARFALAVQAGAGTPSEDGDVLARLEVTAAAGERLLAECPLHARDFRRSGEICFFDLPFELRHAETGVEFRIFATGRGALTVRRGVEVADRFLE